MEDSLCQTDGKMCAKSFITGVLQTETALPVQPQDTFFIFHVKKKTEHTVYAALIKSILFNFGMY